MTTVDRLLAEAMELSEVERAELLQRSFETIEEPEEGYEEGTARSAGEARGSA
jgi:hypothetical protein